MLIPSIDLMNGKAVQLRQGKQKVLERADVFELLDEFSLFGEVAIIDLNAALDNGDNRDLIMQLLKRKACRVGGGIRSLKIAQDYLKAGATKIILGSCCQQPWVKKIDKSRLIFAIDADGDYWCKKGWTEVTKQKVTTLIPILSKDCSEFLYTQIQKEGLLQGIDKPRIEIINETSTLPVTVAGGITDLEEINWLSTRGCNAQIGMSIYLGKINLIDAFLAQCDFKKCSLIPTIVQDISNNKILMLAYSNKQSLKLALNKKRGIYYSRSRDQLWEKGKTSGSTQQLIQVDMDCDGDSLIFRVSQKNNACHLDRYSCFQTQQSSFELTQLDALLSRRNQQRPKTSYSSKLFKSSLLRAAKIREEAEELIEAQTFEEVRWESADLVYFALVDAKAKGVNLNDIVNELGSRFNDN